MFELCGAGFERIVQKEGKFLLRIIGVHENGIGARMEREDWEGLAKMG